MLDPVGQGRPGDRVQESADELRPELVLRRSADQFQVKRFEDRRRRTVGPELGVPGLQEIERPALARREIGGPLQKSGERPAQRLGPPRLEVGLHADEVVGREFRFFRQKFADAVDALAGEIMADGIRIVLAGRFVVGREDGAVGRVEGVGQGREWNDPGPVVFVRIARKDGQPVALPADGNASAGIQTDVAIDVGIDRVDGDGGEISQGGREFRPVAGPVHLVGGPRFVAVVQSDPVQGQGLAPGEIGLGGDDGAVRRRADRPDGFAAALQPDHLAADFQREPGAVETVLTGMPGVDRFAVEVQGVRLDERIAPGDPGVVAGDDEGASRDADAGHVEPAFDGLVDLVPDPGQAVVEMHVVGQERLPGDAAAARDRPVVAGRGDRQAQRAQPRPGPVDDRGRGHAAGIGLEIGMDERFVQLRVGQELPEPRRVRSQLLGGAVQEAVLTRGVGAHPGHVADQIHGVLGPPGLEGIAQQGEFQGQPPAQGGRVLIDAVGKSFHGPDHGGRGLGQGSAGFLGNAQEAHEEVGIDQLLPENFGQPPGRGPADEVHLP